MLPDSTVVGPTLLPSNLSLVLDCLFLVTAGLIIR